jgi:hypothetical protein
LPELSWRFHSSKSAFRKVAIIRWQMTNENNTITALYILSQTENPDEPKTEIPRCREPVKQSLPTSIHYFAGPEHLQIANLDLSKGITRLSPPKLTVTSPRHLSRSSTRKYPYRAGCAGGATRSPFVAPVVAVVVPVVVVRGRSFSGSPVPCCRFRRWLAHIRASKIVLNRRNELFCHVSSQLNVLGRAHTIQ